AAGDAAAQRPDSRQRRVVRLGEQEGDAELVKRFLGPGAGTVEIEAELFGHSGWQPGDAWMAETTLGRVMFNELLPLGYPFVNKQMHKKVQAAIINDLAERYPMIVVAQTVDKLKDAGFYWATRSGVTVSMADVLVPPRKKEILDHYE
ncbi:hypothetical protein INQ16_26825, partial [Escherichia coli]|nr:hypothetical protein [Escherichia coli]